MVIFLIILVKTQFELDATIVHCSINALCRIFKIHLRHTSLLLWWHFNIQKHDFKRNKLWSVVWHVSQTPHGRALANKHYHRVLVISWVSDFFFSFTKCLPVKKKIVIIVFSIVRSVLHTDLYKFRVFGLYSQYFRI